MMFETTTVRIGERVADIDWAYDFRSHFNILCSDDEHRDEACERAKDRLRRMEAAIKEGKEVLATTNGSWPRCGLKKVADVGMYDGWPYWRPVPSVMTYGTLGTEWHSFSSITDIEEVTPNGPGARLAGDGRGN